ncbi:hypothetical protein TYRP_001756 [Tyrophagus putrescentiae]|nr:hypothetical protein TYRP_001756 [Tyrophagus putrescentiae]
MTLREGNEPLVTPLATLLQLLYRNGSGQLLGDQPRRGALHLRRRTHGGADVVDALAVLRKVLLHAGGVQVGRLPGAHKGVAHSEALRHHSVHVLHRNDVVGDQAVALIEDGVLHAVDYEALDFPLQNDRLLADCSQQAPGPFQHRRLRPRRGNDLDEGHKVGRVDGVADDELGAVPLAHLRRHQRGQKAAGGAAEDHLGGGGRKAVQLLEDLLLQLEYLNVNCSLHRLLQLGRLVNVGELLSGGQVASKKARLFQRLQLVFEQHQRLVHCLRHDVVEVDVVRLTGEDHRPTSADQSAADDANLSGHYKSDNK